MRHILHLAEEKFFDDRMNVCPFDRRVSFEFGRFQFAIHFLDSLWIRSFITFYLIFLTFDDFFQRDDPFSKLSDSWVIED